MAVLLQLEQQSYSPKALQNMQSEASSLLRASGLEIEWTVQTGTRNPGEFGNLVIFKMKGKCAMDSFPLVPDELGLPLARTHSADGEILSFGEVDCDRVRYSVKRTLAPADYDRADIVLGRALGRVLAHEMYHMLAKSKRHDYTGVTRECLSSRELTRERMALSEKSLNAIRNQIALVKKRKSPARQTAPDEALPLLP